MAKWYQIWKQGQSESKQYKKGNWKDDKINHRTTSILLRCELSTTAECRSIYGPHRNTWQVIIEHLICPQQCRHSPLQNDRFLNRHEYFKPLVSKISDKIPSESLKTPGTEYHTSPWGPQNCTVITEVFDKKLVEEEFNTVIAIYLTITAPSLTGLKFNMIWKGQTTSKCIFTVIYNQWSSKDVPINWIWKRLCENSERPQKSMVETHLEKYNISLGCT